MNTLEWVRAIFGQRRSTPALRAGGLRWVSATDDAITFLREGGDESILVHATRGRRSTARLPADYFGSRLIGLTGARDIAADGEQLSLPGPGPAFDWWRLDG